MPIEYLYIMAGRDVHRRAQLLPGQSGLVRLLPGAAVVSTDQRRIRMRYFIEGKPEDKFLGWTGPELPNDVSYRVSIGIYPEGRVETSYCIKPCLLPD